MKKLFASLALIATPMLLVLLSVWSAPSLCLVLFLIFPPLVLLCIIPAAGLLPTDFTTFL